MQRRCGRQPSPVRSRIGEVGRMTLPTLGTSKTSGLGSSKTRLRRFKFIDLRTARRGNLPAPACILPPVSPGPPRNGGQHGASIADGLTTAERSPPRKLARRRGPSHSSDRVCPGDRGHHTDDLASFAERLAAGGGASLSRSRKSTTESPRSVTREGLQCHLTIALGRLSKLLAAPVPNHIDCPSLVSLRRLRALLSLWCG